MAQDEADSINIVKKFAHEESPTKSPPPKKVTAQDVINVYQKTLPAKKLHQKLEAQEKINKTKGSDFYYNPSTNEMELKSDPSPHRPAPQVKSKPMPIVKYINTMNKLYGNADPDPAAGAKYIDWWDRIETKK